MRIVRRIVTPAAALAAAFAGPAVLAQDVTDPVDPLEDQALREEAAGRLDEALETFREAFRTAVERAAGGVDPARNRARAETLLEKVDSLTEGRSRQGETEAFLAERSDAELGPLLAGHVDYRRALYRLAEGDREGAMRLAGELGLVREWFVVGPFDNERGRSFRVGVEAIESGPDLAAEYDGKERKVAWRDLPVQGLLGYVDLDALLRPNDQAYAYALALVRSPADRDAAVRLGSDEAVRMWWNGREVLTRDARRTIGFDQDVVAVRLREGWNALLLKVHDQTGPWGFRARLTDLAGAPLADVEYATDLEEAASAVGAIADPLPPQAEAAVGAKGFYDGVVDTAESRGARDLFHLGLLHSRRSFDSFSDRRAEELLRRAAEAEPENAIYRFHYAESAAPPAELAVEKEENRQRIAREKALELDPGYAVAYRALAGYYTSSLVNLERAEHLLRKALELNPDFLEARIDLVDVLRRRGLAAAAELERNRVLDHPRADTLEAAQRIRADATQRNGMGPEALTAWREVLTLDHRGNDVRRRVAELAARALDREQALGVLEEIHGIDPFDTGALARKAEILEGAGELESAARELDRALAVAPEDEDLLQAKGRVELKRGDRDAALETFREALRVNPKLASLERYVEFLDPAAAPFEEDFAIDVAPLVEAVAGRPNEENDPYVVLLDQMVTKVNRDGTSSNYHHYAWKILTDAGVKQFDRYRASGWGGESFKWRGARVIKPDGTVVEVKTNVEQRYADPPPLAPGDVFEVEYRRDDRQQSVFGDYFGEVFYFADQVPVELTTWTLLTPAERAFHFHRRNFDAEATESLLDDGRTRAYTFERRSVPKIRMEPGMPDHRELWPQVQVTTYANWDEFARWWSSMIRDQHIASDSIKAKVAELVAGKETRLDKVRAIYDFVTGEITYQAWAFGPHGYQPYTTTAIFEKREGDCKDKAILFNTMLREIGVDAYPVLIYGDVGRSEEDLSLAMVGHFNHCISYVPDADGQGTPLWLDGTAQYHSAFLPPMMDRGAKVLVVKPEGAELTEIPWGDASDSGIDQKWHAVVHADGSADLAGEFTFRGDTAVGVRQGFSVEGQRPLLLQQLLAQSFGKVELGEYDFDDLRDLSKPSTSFRVKAHVPNFVRGQGESVVVPTGFYDIVRGLLGQLSRMASRPEREHDLVLANPQSFRVEATYELPPGWTVEAAPEDADLAVKAGAFRSQASAEGGKLSIVRTVELREPRVERADYPGFRELLNRAFAIAQQEWKLRKGAAPPEPAPAEEPAPGVDEGR